MANRMNITDYAGDELRSGDLVTYAARQGNRVRMADATVLEVTTRKAGGRLVPMLRVRPTGSESGFSARRSMRAEWIGAEHVRLLAPANG